MTAACPRTAHQNRARWTKSNRFLKFRRTSQLYDRGLEFCARREPRVF